MKTVFFDCNFGAAGDMITAALLELFEDKEKITEELNELGIPDVKFVPEEVTRGGIRGTHMSVKINGMEEPDDWKVHTDEHHEHTHAEGEIAHSHEHRSYGEVQEIIKGLNVSIDVRENALAIYNLIAAAEGKAHGTEVKDVHFHEVGKMDAIADVTAVCYLIEKLAPERIISTPIAVGSGVVKCAHGIMSVPTPATLNILEGVPIMAGVIPTESCTPTGAAILKYFVTEFGDMPELTIEKTGYGMGSRIFPGIPGGLRAMLCL